MALPSLGRRGEGWVVLQFVLGALIAALGLFGPRWQAGWSTPLLVIGVVVAVPGIGILVAGIRQLGSSMTPLPRPTERGSLREDGLYRVVRHPIYFGLLMVSIGWSLARGPLALGLSAAFAVFLELKSRREEAWLIERYPAYEAYRSRVRWKFVPGVR